MLTKYATVLNQHHGLRTDLILARLFPDYSRSQLSTWLKAGFISLNQRNLKPKDKLWGGEELKLELLETTHNDHKNTAENIPIDIVFEDEQMLILNKNAGLVVHPGAGNPQHTLVNALLYHEPSLHALPRAGIIHRLDKDTTGLLIVAKTLNAHTHLIRQMQTRTIKRQYLALVYGHLISGAHIESSYGRDPHNRLKMAVCTHGKQAITQFSLKHQYNYATLIDINLMTGRTHQIRVHMAHINHPVVGDQLYGGRPRIAAGISINKRMLLQQFKRQALHAYALTLVHPGSQTLLSVNAPLPDDFQQLLLALEHDDA